MKIGFLKRLAILQNVYYVKVLSKPDTPATLIFLVQGCEAAVGSWRKGGEDGVGINRGKGTLILHGHPMVNEASASQRSRGG